VTGLASRLLPRNRALRYAFIALVAVLVLTVAEVVAGTSELTARGTASAALRLSVPILLAGLGGLYSERAGVVNIGLEGMMIAGTWFAAWGSWTYGPWRGVLLGIVGGAIFGLLHAVATVTFNVDHIVSGVAINILGLGAMRFLSSIVYNPETGGSVVQSPAVQGLSNVNLPFLAGGNLFGWHSPDLLVNWEKGDWFLVSDVAGVFSGALVFGFGDSLQFRGGPVVQAFMLAVAISLVGFAVISVLRNRVRRAVIMGVLGAGFLAIYLLVEEVPPQLINATPYVITLLVLAVATQRLRMPAADGARYAKGEAH
jgi:ABC-type uncharacterized transport system permease subunit